MADFVLANYETDAGAFRPIKVASMTITAVNVNGATAGTGSIVRAGGSRRRYGTVAREITISRQIGTVGAYDQATVSVTVPILKKSVYEGLGFGATFIYGGKEDWTVTSKRGESTR